MSGICKTEYEVERWWCELERVLFEELDHKLKRKGISETEFESDIHDLKTEIGDELSAGYNRVHVMFVSDYSKEGMPVKIIKSEFIKIYEEFEYVADGRIHAMIDMKEEI
ncbi:hypothetical protein [Enterococcus wangshanyuanii]|uniref:Uncharacterized protein n=1 Tax=Enterococcus wangshanyuanii TaxID=2005703 RepID=A0ABQ1PD88_9ENTE|nr:hypothetical protein [Enterococcus wangshanyuanii]MTD40286.1 hypothetical protein [Erwinia sp. CPCC 100877]GGC94908.1 hypothetical protein GCM10011573_25690 [Enterococcus wangshanyuanii]